MQIEFSAIGKRWECLWQEAHLDVDAGMGFKEAPDLVRIDGARGYRFVQKGHDLVERSDKVDRVQPDVVGRCRVSKGGRQGPVDSPNSSSLSFVLAAGARIPKVRPRAS